jgi:hypothetical protein
MNRGTIVSIAILLAAMTLAPAVNGADETAISKRQADALLSSGKLKPVKKKAEMPKIWWSAMNLDSMSDIGGPFSAGCTGSEPHRRMVAGAVAEPYGVLIEEQGGIAYMMELRVFKHEKNAVKRVYSEMVMMEPRRTEVLKSLNVQSK